MGINILNLTLVNQFTTETQRIRIPNLKRTREAFSQNKQMNEKLFQHTFVVSLEQIQLENDRPIHCTIKYSFSLFSDNDPTQPNPN